MVTFESAPPADKKPLIAATMFGVTTPCIDYAREHLEQHGYEVNMSMTVIRVIRLCLSSIIRFHHQHVLYNENFL